MPVPSPRNKILPARGNYADLASNVASLLDGEICYAIDQDQHYQNEGGVLVSVGATKAQGALADSATQPGDNVSTLTNDAGYITSAQAPVQSVAGKTGVVTLVKADITDFSDADYATAAQGALADSATQPGDNVSTLTNDAGYITSAQAPVQSVAGKTGIVTLVKGDVGLGNVDNTSDLNKPISTATQSALDLKADLVGGVIPNSQLPSLAISEYLGSVASQAAMLALVGQRGDWAIRTDTGSTWVITTDGGSLLSDWTELATPADAVTSVNGYTGTVVLSKADVGLGNVDNTSDLNKPISTATQTALNLKADLASPALTGTPTAPTATAGTNTTQLATTAFVSTAVANKTTNFNDLTNKTSGTGNYTTTGTFTGNTLASTVATGTAPLTVASTTVVTNLNADLLDGQQGSYYLNTATNFGGDVSGTYDNIVIANDSHTHAFDNLTGKTSGTGNYTTTGDFTSAAVIPTGATVPTNGMYLPSANQVGFATNSAFKFGVDSLDGNPLFENNYPTIRPTLDLRFAATKKLDPRITFTRASTGTYTDQFGVLQTAAIDQARFDHDPTTGESLGLLVEESRTNSLLRSEEFDDASWGKTATTVSSNVSSAPNGTVTADKLIEDVSTGGHVVIQSSAQPDNTTLTSSCYCKAAERDWVAVTVVDKTGTLNRRWFNLSTGQEGSTNGTVSGFSATDVGNGWYRIAVSASSAVGATTPQIRISLGSADNTASYTGDGTSGIYLWGAQLEAGSFPTSYIPTTSATVTRAADVASITGTNFSSWYRQDEGTVFAIARCNAVYAGSNSFPRILSISDGGLNQTIEIANRVLSPYTDTGTYVFDGGVSQFGYDTNQETNGKAVALGLRQDDFAQSVGGLLTATDNSGTMPVVNTLRFAARPTGLNVFNGTLRRITYWPQRLSDATLQAITQ